MDSDNDSEIAGLITRTKFPSAYAGQELFIQGDDWQNNAMLGWTHFPLDLYAAGYKDAADALIAALAEGKAPLDSVVYPLVFLYRHGLELELKLILPVARRLAGEEPASDQRHGLMPMWSELRRHLELLDPRQDEKELPAIEGFIHKLDSIDPGSFSFRYPKSKKGEVSLPDLRHVNVRHLSEIMDSVFMMLSGIYSWLGEMDQQPGYY
ncbi:hypothetical protein LMG32289_01203 [Cupriavidus pampae]|uniref:Uncharacterized protein n=2 Tax=Cupriavidus pampae TaxID=659251 RepID=A0ABN7Y0I0_9BURK|nr:hypothetical protein LMG32289_01203 [Cupriavidus pampae]